MKNRLIAIAAASGLALMATVAFAENPMVGGAAMFPNKDIVDNAVNSKDHTTLVAAVKAAGLVETLKGKGPFTVFAPTNVAFAKLPAGTVDTLLKPENKEKLATILKWAQLWKSFANMESRTPRSGCSPAPWKNGLRIRLSGSSGFWA